MSGRNVNIGRDAVGNIIQIGDHDTAELRYKKVQLPPPENVDIRKEIDALRQLLGQLKTDDQQKIVNAISEAAGDAAKPMNRIAYWRTGLLARVRCTLSVQVER